MARGEISQTWKASYADGVIALLEKELFPALGARPIAARGALEMSKKSMQLAGQVFRFGVATGRCERDLTPDLKGALKTRKAKHIARVTEAELPELMRKIAEYDGEFQTRLALQFLALTFVRTGR